MNSGIFFELVKNAPDSDIIQKYCLAFPEFKDSPKSNLWLNLIRERYGDDFLPDFQDRYQVLVNHELHVDQCLQEIKRDPDQRIRVNSSCFQEIIGYRDGFYLEAYKRVPRSISPSTLRKALMRVNGEITIINHPSEIDWMKFYGRGLTIRVRMNIILQHSLMDLLLKMFPICEEIMLGHDPNQLIVEFGYYKEFYISLNLQREDNDQQQRLERWTLHNVKESDIHDFLLKIPPCHLEKLDRSL